MKKSILIVIILIIPLIAFAQTAKEYYDKGAYKIRNWDFVGAIQDFNKAIELDPNYLEAYFNRGNAKGYLKDFRGAIQDFNKALEFKSEYSFDIYAARGSTWLDLGEYKKGLQDCNKSIELEADNPRARACRAIAKILLGQKESGCLELSELGAKGEAGAYVYIEKYCY